MAVMLKEMFSRLTPNSERALAERVQKEGGIDTVQNNDQLLRTLLQTSPANAQERGVSSAPSRGGQKNAPKRSTKPRETYTLSDLKEELRENQDDALKNHLNAFVNRFYQVEVDVECSCEARAVVTAIGPLAAAGQNQIQQVSNKNIPRINRNKP